MFEVLLLHTWVVVFLQDLDDRAIKRHADDKGPLACSVPCPVRAYNAGFVLALLSSCLPW